MARFRARDLLVAPGGHFRAARRMLPASMFRQRLAYPSEWGRWALVMGEDPAHPRSDVVREAEMAEMIRVPPEDPDKSGSAAAVAGRMAARRALRSLLLQSKPETRAALLAYVQERAATLRRHAQREGPIGYLAPVVALASGMGKPCETPGAGPVITQESSCGLPGAPLRATATSTAFCAQASGGQTAKTSGPLSAAALGSCGVGAPQDRTYVPECKPEFFTSASSSASSATITGMASLYVPAAGCTIVGSQSVTVFVPSGEPLTAAANTLTADDCSCDERGTLIQQYTTYAVGWVPECSDFTQTSTAPHFQFSELKSPDASWAILRANLLNGLEGIRTEMASAITINSGYRTPAHNSQVGAATSSRHVFGDASDMASNSGIWDSMRQAAKNQDACVEPRSATFPTWVHADWRGACPAGW